MNRYHFLILILLGVGGGIYWYWPSSRGKEILRLPGIVEVQEVRLGSQVGGRVAEVKVREGDIVEPGQELVWFETEELTARRDQAQFQLESARAAWQKAQNGPRAEEIAQAKAALDGANARLAKMKDGSREEEKRKARSDWERELANQKKAEEEYNRVSNLSAVSPLEREAALANRDQARAMAKSARAMLDLSLAGNRIEDLQAAEADKALYEAQYELLRKGVRDEDKAIAYAAVGEAEAQLRYAQHQLRESVVRARERSVVEVVSVRPGDLVAPGQPVLRVLRASDLWVKVFVPSTELGKLRLGQKVEVTVDSHPNRRFAGEVFQIANMSEFTPRNVQSLDERQHQVFAVKVRVENSEGIFKSGMAAVVFLDLSGGT